ncbi:MAG: nitrite reductase small subunit NirD [Acidimicrobiales bacterium]
MALDTAIDDLTAVTAGPAPWARWVPIAPLDRIPVERGVAALVDDHPVAVFRLADGALAAIDHIDPFTGVPVLARGLIGSVGDQAVVASPLHKQRFDLHTGRCLDEPSVTVRTWAVEARDGMVMVAAGGS